MGFVYLTLLEIGSSCEGEGVRGLFRNNCTTHPTIRTSQSVNVTVPILLKNNHRLMLNIPNWVLNISPPDRPNGRLETKYDFYLPSTPNQTKRSKDNLQARLRVRVCVRSRSADTGGNDFC